MANDIVMPNLGFDAQEGRLVEWLKQPGDSIQKGEVIAIVESDKANVELQSIAAGILLEHLCKEDETVTVGAIIARIGDASEGVKWSPDANKVPVPKSAPGGLTVAAAEASPVARRMAQEQGIDLSTVSGSGPRGKITREDVEAASKPSNGASVTLALPKVRKAAREAGVNLALVPATGTRGQVTMTDLQSYQQRTAHAVTPPPVTLPEDAQEVEVSKVRQIIGERLGQSKRDAPHFYVTGEFDLEAALAFLEGQQAGINDLLQYLTVQTLLRVPELNATYEKGRLLRHQAVNLAIAVAREDGLITPVLPRAERFSLTGLAEESRTLIRRARDNRMQPADLQAGTFTISNLGVIPQVEHFTAVINPPQVAILAVGSMKPRPVVIDGGLYIRHTAHLTLSGDHRVVDGIHLAQFMAAFQDELDKLE
jgi:pyruvate dehydrogenase E2 component (dihydrolipoamide acetyltransferase)